MALFGSHPQQQNPMASITPEIEKSKKRQSFVGKDADELDKGITIRDEKMNSDFKGMQNEVSLLHEEIRGLRTEMRKLMKHAQKLIISLQSKAKKEDLEAITKLTDKWSPEEYINKNAFIRLAGEEIKNYLTR